MIEVLRRFLSHIGRRSPPRLGDVADFDMDADRQAARYEAMQRRRPPADPWLRQGDGYNRGGQDDLDLLMVRMMTS